MEDKLIANTESTPVSQPRYSGNWILFACGIIGGGVLISPMLSLLLSKFWWETYHLSYSLPGDMSRKIPLNYGPVWLCDWSSYVTLSIMGVTFQLVAVTSQFYKRVAQRGEFQWLFKRMMEGTREPYSVSRFVWLSRACAWYILLPLLMILLYLGLWAAVKGVQGDTSAIRASISILKRLAVDFGPALCLGLCVLLLSKAVVVVDVLRNSIGRKPSENVLNEATLRGTPYRLRILSALGGLLVLPCIVAIVLLCWIATVKQYVGANSLQGLNRFVPALLNAIYAMGPANLLGCAILLWTSSEWLDWWCRNKLRRQGTPHSSVLRIARLGSLFSCLLMSPVLVVLAASCLVTLNRLVKNSIELDGLSSEVMLNYGGIVVAGCLGMVLSGIVWYIAICLDPARNRRVEQESLRPMLARLSKLGVVIGCVLLSPLLVRIVVMSWTYFYFRFVVPHPSRMAWHIATEILQREFEIIHPFIMGGYLILIASGLGVAVSYLMRNRQIKPVVRASGSFDDM